MAKNKMADVAKILGVELDEEFELKNSNFRYKLTTYGLRKRHITLEEWVNSSILNDLLLGKVEIVKKAKSILDAAEKRYLSAVIKPFRKHIITIRKIEYYKYEFIAIVIYRTDEGASCEVISLPYFNKGKMYKGMEINKEYAPEELGL